MRWILGLPVGWWSVVSILLAWITAITLVYAAFRVPYPTPGVFNEVERRTGNALGPQRAPSYGLMVRLRKLLRFRYRDYGSGPRALEGQVVTLSLRSGDVFVGGSVIAILLFLFAAGLPTTMSSDRFSLALVALGFGTWFGTFVLTLMGLSYQGVLTDQLRQLPISGRVALNGVLAAVRRLIVSVALVVTFGMGLVFRDPLLGFLLTSA
jgi:hypothetical protein